MTVCPLRKTPVSIDALLASMTAVRYLASMPKFPDAAIRAMHHAGTTVTCMPVVIDESGQALAAADTLAQSAQLADAIWESAVFFVLPLSVTNKQLKKLFPSEKLFPVALEADLIEHDNGTLIELVVEIDLGLKQNPSGVLLFLTGHISSHYEAVQLLAKQDSIGLFIGDVHCNLLHQQKIPLADAHRSVFNEMLQEALRRDALIRMSGKYDAEAVFDSVAQKS